MMPISKDNIIKNIIDGFQARKGKMSFYCFDDEFIPEIIYNVIMPFHKKRSNEQIFIVTDTYDTRVKIINYLKSKYNITAENGYNIKILSQTYINAWYHYIYNLTIIVGVNDNFDMINHLNDESKFTMCILTKNIMNTYFINSVRNILPNIDIENTAIATIKAHINSPVEEHLVGVELSDKDKETYDKYTDIINTTISILGSLDNIEKCKNGDSVLNISAAEFRTNLAKQNGWSENFDTNIPFMRQIDEYYNPEVIKDRACNFYSIAKNRRDLCTDNDAKLDAILDICIKNEGKRILIISKRGEYAAKVADYLNSNGILCGNYHDCLDNIPAIDKQGNLILYKSGTRKGQPKFFGWQAQSSLNEKRFNDKTINVLSIKNASNVELKIACDMVILTSSKCDSIIDIKTRFANVEFIGVPTIVYRIYCNGTIESNHIYKRQIPPNVKIINDTEHEITFDENSNDIII